MFSWRTDYKLITIETSSSLHQLFGLITDNVCCHGQGEVILNASKDAYHFPTFLRLATEKLASFEVIVELSLFNSRIPNSLGFASKCNLNRSNSYRWWRALTRKIYTSLTCFVCIQWLPGQFLELENWRHWVQCQKSTVLPEKSNQISNCYMFVSLTKELLHNPEWSMSIFHKSWTQSTHRVIFNFEIECTSRTLVASNACLWLWHCQLKVVNICQGLVQPILRQLFTLAGSVLSGNPNFVSFISQLQVIGWKSWVWIISGNMLLVLDDEVFHITQTLIHLTRR